MNKLLLTLVTGGLVIAAGFNTAVAQDDDSAAAVEVYTCSYADGKGAADLDKAVANWNEWADDQGMADYSAWTMTPFYSSSEQDFDVIWLGASDTGKAMGAAQDMWLAKGGTLRADFNSVIPCDSHSMFAAVQFKAPPKREDPSSSFVLDFTDCTIDDGKHFSTDVAPALKAWSEYRTGQESTAGMWAFFPVYGGGGEEYDFKFVVSHGSYLEQGIDFDNYDPAKAREIFPYGMLDCDSSRSYIATNRRMAESDDE